MRPVLSPNPEHALHPAAGFGGRDNGMEALEQYTETKTIWITLR